MRKSSALAVFLTLSSIPVALSHGSSLLDLGCGRVKRSNNLERRQTAAVPTTASEGASSDSPGGASAAGYSCDSNTCKAPACMCASTKPPGGLALRWAAKGLLEIGLCSQLAHSSATYLNSLP